MQYEINMTRAKLKAEEINTLSGSIGWNVFNISALYVSLRLIGAPSIQYVVKRVQKQNAAIATEVLRLGAMGRSLDRISTCYYNAENEVAGNRTVTGSVLNDIFFQRRHDASNSEMDELISKFEKEHPEYAKKLDELLASGKHNKLTEDDIRKIKYLAYTAEEPYRSIYLRLLGKYRIGEGNLKKGAYYQPGEHTINFTYRNCFENDPRGEYTTFFHESGHAVDDLAELARQVGYVEGLPVVEDPGILSPKAFLDELMSVRFPNPYLGDTSARIATDVSQMTAIRFGETVKAYVARDGDAKKLVAIPLAIAGWIRYLLAVDDEGKPMELSPDPMIPYMKEQLSGIEFNHPESLTGQLKGVLSNETLFGTDLYKAGIGELIEEMVRSEISGPGAVRKTLKEYLRK